MSRKMEPLILRRKGAIQLTYDIPHRITSTRVYPTLAPNGSTVIICGLDTGLRIIWRGGKPLKSPKQPNTSNSIINGNNPAEVMVIDSDEEEAQASTSNREHPKTEFAAQYDEVDPDEPYEGILRTLDIPLSSVRHLSIPNVPRNIAQVASGAYPPILSDHILVAVACVDFSVALIAIPLLPPAFSVIDHFAAGVQVVKIAGPQSHQDLPTSVSVTHTSDDGELNNRSRSRSRNQGDETSASNKEWSFLVASTSPTAGGILLVHEVALNKETMELESSVPIQRQYLRSGVGCKVEFNPSASPSPRHSNLLVVYPSGTVRIYQCIPEQNARQPRPRRGSSATMDSMTSKSSAQNLGGKFLITLYSPFAQTATIGTVRRKKILDAAWILGGSAIIALVEDGTWGIWDIEGAASEISPDGKPQTLLQGHGSHPAVLNARALVQLSLKGRIISPHDTKHQDEEIIDKSLKPAKLAPATPHTRKIRSDGLFSRTNSYRTNAGGAEFAHPTGGISVSPTPSRSNASDEAILVFYGRQNVYIPSLQSFLRSSSQARQDTFNSSSAIRPIAITSLTLPPDVPQTFLAALPPSPLASTTSAQPTLAFAATPSLPDILATTAHHLIFLCKPIEEPSTPESDDMAIDDEDGNSISKSLDFPQEEDQLLLTQGELGIEGMGRILDGMNQGGRSGGADGTPTKSKLFGRSIGAGSSRKRQGVGR